MTNEQEALVFHKVHAELRRLQWEAAEHKSAHKTWKQRALEARNFAANTINKLVSISTFDKQPNSVTIMLELPPVLTHLLQLNHGIRSWVRQAVSDLALAQFDLAFAEVTC